MSSHSVHTLAEIGLKAVAVQEAVEVRKRAAEKFGLACHHWKQKHGIVFVEKHSPDWDRMLSDIATTKPGKGYDEALRLERNAKRRLERACRKELNTVLPQ